MICKDCKRDFSSGRGRPNKSGFCEHCCRKRLRNLKGSGKND